MSLQEQKDILVQFLQEQVDNDYVYLDAPAYLNVGDMLITMGVFECLKSVAYRCLRVTSNVNYRDENIPSNAVILMQGGGNFGDLYPGANWYRMEIAKRYPNNKIIILPVTTTYLNKSLIPNEAQALAQHKNLHICGRDKESYKFLKQNFGRNIIHLLPDCAMGLAGVLPRQMEVSQRKLHLKRKDNEGLPNVRTYDAENVYDWDDILREVSFKWVYGGYKISRKMRKIIPCELFKTVNDWYLIHIEYPFILKNVSRKLLTYGKIYTTRMHGYILASLLGIEIEWEDTKYGKLSGYINTWMNEK